MHTKSWHVDVIISEQDVRTHCEAALVTEGGATALSGTGSARRNPRDADVPEIGDELATARALADLAHKLLETAAGDIEAATHERVGRLS